VRTKLDIHFLILSCLIFYQINKWQLKEGKHNKMKIKKNTIGHFPGIGQTVNKWRVSANFMGPNEYGIHI